MDLLINSDLFAFIFLPLMIFTARVLDVSLGTIRVIFISRGFKYYAPIIGFIEVLIWLLAIAQIMKNLDNIYLALAYALGFSAGTFIGIWIEEKLSLGTVLIQVITRKNALGMLEQLKEKKFRVTSIEAEEEGYVKMFFIVTKRSKIKKVIEIINEFNPRAFYAIEDVRSAKEGIIHHKKKHFFFKSFMPFRKSK